MALELLWEVSVVFPENKDFIAEKLEEKFFRQNILVEVIYFLLFCFIDNESLSSASTIVVFSFFLASSLLCNKTVKKPVSSKERASIANIFLRGALL